MARRNIKVGGKKPSGSKATEGATTAVEKNTPVNAPSKPHYISFMSGKGGTGKTVIAVCLGTLLMKLNFRVLFVDLDFATDGLSYFLAGANGLSADHRDTLERIQYASDFILGDETSLSKPFINRHKISQNETFFDEPQNRDWHVLFSGKKAFGFEPAPSLENHLINNPGNLTVKLRGLFDAIAASNDYDFVIVDTRGGFDAATVEVAPFIDSLVMVGEPDHSSVNQAFHLARNIDTACAPFKQKPNWVGLVLNKSTASLRADQKWVDDAEIDFRHTFMNQIGIKIETHYVLPLDDSVILSYRNHNPPMTWRPDSMFSLSLMYAFSNLFAPVIGHWSDDKLEQWDRISKIISAANDQRIEDENKSTEARVKSHKLFRDLNERSEDALVAKRRAEEEVAYLRRRLEDLEDAQSKQIEQGNRAIAALENSMGRQALNNEELLGRIEKSFVAETREARRATERQTQLMIAENEKQLEIVSQETRNSVSGELKLIMDRIKELESSQGNLNKHSIEISARSEVLQAMIKNLSRIAMIVTIGVAVTAIAVSPEFLIMLDDVITRLNPPQSE